MNRPPKRLTVLISLAFAAAGSNGCTQKTSQEEAPGNVTQNVVASAAASATDAAPPHRPKTRRHEGPVGLLFDAADALDLTPAQQATVADLEKDLRPGGSDRAPREAWRSDLAAGIRAGSLDTAKLSADEEAIKKVVDAERNAQAAAVDGLHAALTPAQRKSVSDAVTSKLAEHEGHKPPPNGDGGEGDWAKKRLDRLTKDLDLDASQQKQVASLLSRDHGNPDARHDAMEAGKQRLDALLAAFAGDSFDAGALGEPADAGKKAHGMEEHEAAFVARLLPVLKPEQRDKLAASMQRQRGFEWHDVRGRESPGDDDGNGGSR